MTTFALMTNCVGRAGAEMQMVRLAIELKRLGHDVSVLSILTPQDLGNELRAADVPLVNLTGGPPYPKGARVPKARVLRGVVPAIRTLRSRRTQALICFVHEATLFGRVVGRLAGVPVIIGSERDMWREGPIDTRISRWTQRLLDATVVNSSAIADDLVRRRIVPRERVAVIPNGMDAGALTSAPEHRAQARDELAVDDDFVWLAVGRLTPQKDYPNMLDALRTLADKRPGVRLLIAGSGTLRPELEQRCADLGIDDRVAFLGERRDVPRLLAAADGLVMSSESEGMPNAVMEGLAAGVPVVATAVGGVPELVVPGTTGVLVPPADPNELAEGMLQLMDTPANERAELGRKGQRHVAATYDMGSVTQRWLDLVDGVLDRRRRRRPARTRRARGPRP